MSRRTEKVKINKREEKDGPAMGGKRKASKARNMSLEHIFFFFF